MFYSANFLFVDHRHIDHPLQNEIGDKGAEQKNAFAEQTTEKEKLNEPDERRNAGQEEEEKTDEQIGTISMQGERRWTEANERIVPNEMVEDAIFFLEQLVQPLSTLVVVLHGNFVDRNSSAVERRSTTNARTSFRLTLCTIARDRHRL